MTAAIEAAPATPRSIGSAERDYMATATAIAAKEDAFSVSFTFSPDGGMSHLVYFKQPSPKQAPDDQPSTGRDPRTNVPPARVPPARVPSAPPTRNEKPSKQSQKTTQKQHVKQASRAKSKQSKVDRNAMSARGSKGGRFKRLSDAAIAAQKRADDAAELEKKRKRRRDTTSCTTVGDELEHEDGDISPIVVHGRSEGGDPKGFFTSREHAAAFLDDLDLHLYEDERTGALVGHHRTTGENYGGQDGAPITPQMIVAYMLVHDEAWQTVQAGGKRARAAK